MPTDSWQVQLAEHTRQRVAAEAKRADKDAKNTAELEALAAAAVEKEKSRPMITLAQVVERAQALHAAVDPMVNGAVILSGAIAAAVSGVGRAVGFIIGLQPDSLGSRAKVRFCLEGDVVLDVIVASGATKSDSAKADIDMATLWASYMLDALGVDAAKSAK